MKVFGIAGYSGSGKTTLLEKLIPQFTARGLRVSVIKHAHHGFDSWALMHERRDGSDVTLDELLARLAPCDLVLVEGFKQEPIPKLEVYRPENGKPPLFPERSDIVAVASNVALAASLPRLALDDVAAIADFVMNTLQLQERPC